MTNKYSVFKIMNCLQQRVAFAQNKTLLIPNVYGELYVGKFAFNSSATKSEIRAFIDKFNIQLPIEYEEFLRCCNGAILFDIGLGMRTEIYGLDMLTKFMNTIFDNRPQFLPVASNPKANFFIDATRHENYLFWNEGSPKYICLEMEFAEWLGHLITANGSDFWNWNPMLQCRDIYNTVNLECMKVKVVYD
ncbi:SMI1/KNR4 family protein [Paenibacillus sp. 481]|uniref:SMI1/KNR4 family protein n=1 Tax=Paenibacillus sp. 481 TaxID=2835869 RepID=UPI001E2A69E7|nr:SMI1/KNR4 family protein [Paenibacillus sp. 481]UHA72058.1 SMI1/KNR4 family protein [Paenibacillus sp. 481]